MPKPILVIGIHQEELAFGERVAELVEGLGIDVLRIEQGLSNRKPIFDDLFYYTTQHREIYLQLRQQVKKRYDLLIDLHSGINESESCADIFCKHVNMLNCLKTVSKQCSNIQCSLPEPVRFRRIIEDLEKIDDLAVGNEDLDGKTPQNIYPICRTVIPQTVWASKDFIYVGLEIYLPKPGEGTMEDWLFTAEIVECILKCTQSLRSSPPG
ncbi:MAG: hypothetical protein LWX01_05295 [Deltaproteobacteria bacterium]|nr:hypothetical protein [Deltaproteobacteria bacterium]MDL1961103.1 hypothetical protein [Deltaproteobacteria bacterium]